MYTAVLRTPRFHGANEADFDNDEEDRGDSVVVESQELLVEGDVATVSTAAPDE